MLQKILILVSVALLHTAHVAYAGINLIRDAQTEKFLRDLSSPVFKAAKLDVNNINIYIVNDSSLNAFVSGGQNMFLNTGLIRKYETPDALIGVVAHETGHIAAGHLARSSEALEKSSNAMMLSYLLGIGAAVAGSPEAAQAIIVGGASTAERLFLKYNRGQEEAADQHAISYLEKLAYPADGLVELLEFFESQMIGYKGQIDEYALSHPISKKRIDLIKERTKGSHFSDTKINSQLQATMDIILAKLEGFMDNPDEVLRKYRDQHDELARYAKSIALFKKGRVDLAVLLLNQIIASKEKSSIEVGFLFELKGQFLFESGNIEEAAIAYGEALKLLQGRDAAQARVSFASAILAVTKNDKALIEFAIQQLQEAKIYEYDNPFLFKQLASAYDKMGDVGRSYLSLAEFSFWRGDNDKAVKYAAKAKEELPSSAKRELLRADDLIMLAKDENKK